MTSPSSLNVLRVDSSARHEASVSRQLLDDTVAALRERYPNLTLTRRDTAAGVPLIDNPWVEATFTPVEARTAAQHATLAGSDTLVEELEAADLVLLGVPIYNFSVPAALKLWIDQVARAGRTFRYSQDGPEGLLTGKRAWIVVTSGGVAADSPADFATPYLRQYLGFLGITDVQVIAANGMNADADGALDQARGRIAELALAGAPLDRSIALQEAG